MGKRIAIIGSGNLAWHLAAVLAERAIVVSSRKPKEEWPVPLFTYETLRPSSLDAIFLAVPDNAIGQVSQRLSRSVPATLPVFHTSGATPLHAIDAHFIHRGVLWPIRSLRKGDATGDWKDLPLVYHATEGEAEAYISRLARSLSDTVAQLDDAQRAQLHLAAVFSNNFVTWLYEIAHQLCAEKNIPFDLLLPIIRETARSQDGNSPADRQTGAAARGDTATMERHLSLLKKDEYRQLYKMISKLILQDRLPEHDAHLGRKPDADL